MESMILMCRWKCRCPRIAKVIFKQHKAREHILPLTKTYDEYIVIQTIVTLAQGEAVGPIVQNTESD